MPFFEQLTEKIVQGTEGLAESQAPAVGTSRAVPPKQLFVKRETSVGREIGVSRQFGLFGAVWSANLVKNNNMLITDQQVGLREESGLDLSGSSHPLLNLRAEEFEEITPGNPAIPIREKYVMPLSITTDFKLKMVYPMKLRGSEKNVPLSISSAPCGITEEEFVELTQGECPKFEASELKMVYPMKLRGSAPSLVTEEELELLRGGSSSSSSRTSSAVLSAKKNMLITDQKVGLREESGLDLSLPPVSLSDGVTIEDVDIGGGSSKSLVVKVGLVEEAVTPKRKYVYDSSEKIVISEKEKRVIGVIKELKELEEETTRMKKEEKAARKAAAKEEKKIVKEKKRALVAEKAALLAEKEKERIEKTLLLSVPPGRSFFTDILEDTSLVVIKENMCIMPSNPEKERNARALDMLITKEIMIGLKEFKKEKERKVSELIIEYYDMLPSVIYREGESLEKGDPVRLACVEKERWNKLINKSENKRYWSSDRLKECRPYEEDAARRPIAKAEELRMILNRIHFDEKVDVALQVFLGEEIKKELAVSNLESVGLAEKVKEISKRIVDGIERMPMTERAWLLREKMTMLDLDTVKRNSLYEGKLKMKVYTGVVALYPMLIDYSEWRSVLPWLLEKKEIIVDPCGASLYAYLGSANQFLKENGAGFRKAKVTLHEKYLTVVNKKPKKLARYVNYEKLVRLCGLEGVLGAKICIKAEVENWINVHKGAERLKEIKGEGGDYERDVLQTTEGVRLFIHGKPADAGSNLVLVYAQWTPGAKENRFDFFAERKEFGSFMSMKMYENGFKKIKMLNSSIISNKREIAFVVNRYMETREERYLKELYRMSCEVLKTHIVGRNLVNHELGVVSVSMDLERFNKLINLVVKNDNSLGSLVRGGGSGTSGVDNIYGEIQLFLEKSYLEERKARDLGVDGVAGDSLAEIEWYRPLSNIGEDPIDEKRRDQIENLRRFNLRHVQEKKNDKLIENRRLVEEERTRLEEAEVKKIIKELAFPEAPFPTKIITVNSPKQLSSSTGSALQLTYNVDVSSSTENMIPVAGGILTKPVVDQVSLKRERFEKRVGVKSTDLRYVLDKLKKEREEEVAAKAKEFEERQERLKLVIEQRKREYEKIIKDGGSTTGSADPASSSKKYGFSKFHEFAWSCGKLLITGIINRIKSIFSSHQ